MDVNYSHEIKRCLLLGGKTITKLDSLLIRRDINLSTKTPLFMGFPRQKHWSRLPFPSPRDLSNPGIESLSPSLAGGFFITEPPGKPCSSRYLVKWYFPKKVFYEHFRPALRFVSSFHITLHLHFILFKEDGFWKAFPSSIKIVPQNFCIIFSILTLILSPVPGKKESKVTEKHTYEHTQKTGKIDCQSTQRSKNMFRKIILKITYFKNCTYITKFIFNNTSVEALLIYMVVLVSSTH